MDKEWMFVNRIVKEFISFALKHEADHNSIVCPCIRCGHLNRVSASGLEDHLVCHEIDHTYTCQHKHGESRDTTDRSHGNNGSTYVLHDFETSIDEDDHVEEMASAVEEELQDCLEMLERLRNDARTPLYTGYIGFPKLTAVLRLYNLKARGVLIDTIFI